MAELRKQVKEDLTYYVSPQLSTYPHLRHAYFTRLGGVSQGIYESLNFRFTGTDARENILKNYDIAAHLLGSDANHVVRTTQTHTDNVVAITEKTTEFTSVGDGVDALMDMKAFNNRGAYLCLAAGGTNPETTMKVLEIMIDDLTEDTAHAAAESTEPAA